MSIKWIDDNIEVVNKSDKSVWKNLRFNQSNFQEKFDSIIWYSSAGFDVQPFFLDPLFAVTTHSTNKLKCNPLSDVGITPFPKEIYEITGQQNVLYIFSDLNWRLFHSTGCFGEMYKAFKAKKKIYLKEFKAYNGFSLEIKTYPWVLQNMIPFRWLPFYNSENYEKATYGYNFSGTTEAFEAYHKELRPEWNGFFMSVQQEGHYSDRVFNVLYFLSENKFLFDNLFLPNRIKPNFLVSIDEEGFISDVLKNIAKKDKSLLPDYIIGNNLEDYNAITDLPFRVETIYTLDILHDWFDYRHSYSLRKAVKRLELIQKLIV